MTTEPLGSDELGALLKHTPDWVRGEARAGRLPHHKIGKLYVFTAEDVAEIFAATAVATRPEDPPAPRLPRRDRLPSYQRIGSDDQVPFRQPADATRPDPAGGGAK